MCRGSASTQHAERSGVRRVTDLCACRAEMAAPTISVERDAFAPRRRLLARSQTLRESINSAGRVGHFYFAIRCAAMLAVASKSPTHAPRFRLESYCGRPGLSDEVRTCRAEMAAPITAVQSETLALRRFLTQF